MMNPNYYEEVLQAIQKLMEEGQNEAALARLDEELSMPYIPHASYLIFERLSHELKQKARLEKGTFTKSLEPEELLKELSSDELHQLKALDALSKLNLRAHLPLIHSSFELLTDRLMINLLIRILIEQDIRDEFYFKDEGVEYRFIPASLTLPEESEGKEVALKLLEAWCEKNPSLYQLCLQQLELVTLLKLPQSYEDYEGEDLAKAIFKPLFIQLEDEKAYEIFEESLKLKEAQKSSTH